MTIFNIYAFSLIKETRSRFYKSFWSEKIDSFDNYIFNPSIELQYNSYALPDVTCKHLHEIVKVVENNRFT